MKSRKIRHQFSLEEDASAKLEQLCRKASVTKSELVGKAVEAILEGRTGSELDKRYAQRLNRISRNLSRVRGDTEMILESLALFIRYSITLNAHTPMPDEATQAVARERFLKFVDQVGQQIARGRTTLSNIDDDFDDASVTKNMEDTP
jgi:hypothetical protein